MLLRINHLLFRPLMWLSSGWSEQEYNYDCVGINLQLQIIYFWLDLRWKEYNKYSCEILEDKE